MLAHVPSFGRNPRGSPDFLAYPVPKACMHVLGTRVPRRLGVARSASSPKAAQALGCSFTPGLRISFGRVTCMARAASVPGLWALGFLLLACVCGWVRVAVGRGFCLPLPNLAGVLGGCVWAPFLVLSLFCRLFVVFVVGLWCRPAFGTCVVSCAFPLPPALSGSGVRCGRACWARVSAVPRPSWLGCRVVFFALFFFSGCWVSLSRALWSLPPSPFFRAGLLAFFFFFLLVSVPLFPVGRRFWLGVAGFGWVVPLCLFGGPVFGALWVGGLAPFCVVGGQFGGCGVFSRAPAPPHFFFFFFLGGGGGAYLAVPPFAFPRLTFALWLVCGVVGPSPLLAEVPVCYSPPLLAGFRCRWWWAVPATPGWGLPAVVVCGVWRWCVGGVVAGVWCGWSLATPGGGSCVLLPATPGWVSLPLVVGGPRHSWLGSACGGGVWCVVCGVWCVGGVVAGVWCGWSLATPGGGSCVLLPATPGWVSLPVVVRGPRHSWLGSACGGGVWCVVCGVWRWCVGGVVAGVWCGWSLATPGGGSCVLLPATPGWVSLPVVVGGPRHSWLRSACGGGVWCVVCGGGVLVGLRLVCGVVGPSPLLAEVPVCYSPPLLAGFRCRWWWAVPATPGWGPLAASVCGVWRWCVGGVVAGVWCGWSLATPGGGPCVLLPATPGWVSLPVVVGGPRHSWLGSVGGGGVWCVVCCWGPSPLLAEVPVCYSPPLLAGFRCRWWWAVPATPGWGPLAAVVCVLCLAGSDGPASRARSGAPHLFLWPLCLSALLGPLSLSLLLPFLVGWGLWCVGWLLPGTCSCAVVRCVLCALSGFVAPGGRRCLAPVRVPWLWPAACLSGVPLGPAWCAAPRPVRSLSVVRSAFPTPWCLSPPRELAPPALLGGCAGHAEAGREPGSLCLPLAPTEAGALGSLRVVPVRGPAMGLSPAGPSGVGLGLRALRWLACVDPVTDASGFPYRPSFDGGLGRCTGAVSCGRRHLPLRVEGRHARVPCVFACACSSWPGRAGRPPGRVLVRLTFSFGRFVFLLCLAPSALGLPLSLSLLLPFLFGCFSRPPAAWLAPLLCPPLGRWLLFGGCSPAPPPLCLGFLSLLLVALVFFFFFFFLLPPCAPVVSGFLWFPAPGALGLGACVVCFAGLPLLGSLCACPSFVLSPWLLAAPAWLLPPPPPFVSRGFCSCCSVLCAVLCCASPGAVLRRAAARCVARCCAVRVVRAAAGAWCCGALLCVVLFPVVCRGAVLSLSGRVVSFPVVGVVCRGALLSCVVFCGAVLSRGAVLLCSAVVLRCCWGLLCPPVGCRAVLCCAVGGLCCFWPGGGVCVLWCSFPRAVRSLSSPLCALRCLVVLAVVPCFPVSCAVALCCRVVLCCRALLSFCGAVCVCFALLRPVVRRLCRLRCCWCLVLWRVPVRCGVSLGVLRCGGAALVCRGVLLCCALSCGVLRSVPCPAVPCCPAVLCWLAVLCGCLRCWCLFCPLFFC